MKRPITLVYAVLFLTHYRFRSRPRYQLAWGSRDFKPSFSLKKNTKTYLKLRHDRPSHILPNLLQIQHPAIRCYILWDIWRIKDQLDVTCYFISACNTDTTPTQPHRNSNTHRTKNNTTNVVIQQNSRKLLIMDILMSETCWAHKKWNKIASDIKLAFYSSTITMIHGPINIRYSEILKQQYINV